MYNTILVEKKDNIATITMNQPEKLNATGPTMKRELCQALDELEADPETKVVILTGAGRAFSVGADRKDRPKNYEEAVNLAEIERFMDFGKPLIAMVNGYALGAGAQHALQCDIIIASDRARIGFIGACVGRLCTFALLALAGAVGKTKAAELLLTCEQLSAEEALKIGLVNRVVPHDKLLEATLEVAEKCKKLAPISGKWTKRLLNHRVKDSAMMDLLRQAVAEIGASEDLKEADRAFAENRAPVFKGR